MSAAGSRKPRFRQAFPRRHGAPMWRCISNRGVCSSRRAPPSGSSRISSAFTGSASRSRVVPIMRAQRRCPCGRMRWSAPLSIVETVYARALATVGHDKPLVATVGKLDVLPNAANAVPGEVEMVLEVRCGDEAATRSLRQDIDRRGLALRWRHSDSTFRQSL